MRQYRLRHSLLKVGNGHPLTELIHYDDHKQAFDGLLKREVDAVMGVKGKLEYLDKTDDQAEKVAVDTPPLVNFALNEWTIGIAVNFRYREVFYTADGIIEDMVKDGRMQTIFEKYDVSYAQPDY